MLSKFFPPAEDDSTVELNFKDALGGGICKCKCGKEFSLDNGMCAATSGQQNKKRKTTNHIANHSDDAKNTATKNSLSSVDGTIDLNISTDVTKVKNEEGDEKMAVQLCGECITKHQKLR